MMDMLKKTVELIQRNTYRMEPDEVREAVRYYCANACDIVFTDDWEFDIMPDGVLRLTIEYPHRPPEGA